MKKIFAPSKSQRNHASGLFTAGSLGSAQTGSKKVDVEVAKAAIRFNRRVHSREVRDDRAEKARLRRLQQWWKYRENWRSVVVGERKGKLNPHLKRLVEFPDGAKVWLTERPA
jgi:hypothetical protein